MSDAKVLVDEARRTAQHGQVKGQIQREVAGTERGVRRGRKTVRGGQVVNYLFGIVYALLGIRLLLALVAARPAAAFVQWIRALTDPLLAPFKGLLPNLTSSEGYTLALPVLFALLMYAVLHLAVKGLLRLIGHRETEL